MTVESTPTEEFDRFIFSLVRDEPRSMQDFRKSIKLAEDRGEIELTDDDEELLGHDRKRWETNIQNRIMELKSKGLIAHLTRDKYVAPIPCENPLEPEEFWELIRRAAENRGSTLVATSEHHIHEIGEYYIESVTPNQIKFKRVPLVGSKSIDSPKLDKHRVLGMANALNAVGGQGTRITIGGNKKLYSDLLVPLSPQIDFVAPEHIEIIDIVVNPPEPFKTKNSEVEKELKKRAKTPGLVREGATKFRKKILENYEDTCAVTGSQITDVIHAAHVKPYNGPSSNYVENGIALRSDVHRLFDLFKIRIHPEDLSIHYHPDIKKEYGFISDTLQLPEGSKRPDRDAFEAIWNIDKNKWF